VFQSWAGRVKAINMKNEKRSKERGKRGVGGTTSTRGYIKVGTDRNRRNLCEEKALTPNPFKAIGRLQQKKGRKEKKRDIC